MEKNLNQLTKTPLSGGWRGAFSDFGKKLQTAFVRFPLTFVCIVAVAVLFVLAIKTNTDDIYTQWIMSGIVSAFATLAVSLFAENRWNKLITIAVNIVVVGLSALLFSTFSKNMTDANLTQFALLLVSFGLALFFAGYITERNSLRWWENLQETLFQLVISAFFAGILMAGLSLALVSLDKLFGINIKDEVYQYLAVFCFVLFMPGYFLSQISTSAKSAISSSKGNNTNFDITYPKIFKILGLYILLPILAIYTIILYGYLLKIIVTWELPNGWVSWLVSILGFVGLLVMTILHPVYLKNENKIVNIFSRFFPVIFFPLLILMLTGIVRRFSDYGITINRLLILILNLWFFGISIYLIFSRSRHPKWILISFAIVAFLSAVGPWSVINMTEKSLKKEFTQLLSEANWTNSTADKITPLVKEKQQRIADVANYLQRTFGVETIRPMFSTLGEKANVSSLIAALGISDPQIANDQFFSVNISESSFELNITDYTRVIVLKKLHDTNVLYESDSLRISMENADLKVLQNGKTTEISLLPLIENGFSEKNHSIKPQEMTIEKDDYNLQIFQLDGQQKTDNETKINYLNGLLLIK